MKKKLIPFALLFSYLLPLVGCAGSKTCTITFDPNNGEETFSITVNKGDLIPEPENPEKTAYTFKSWKCNNIKWAFKYETVKEDITLKAFYVPIEYSLDYETNGGILYDYMTSYTTETKENPVDAKKPGYINDYFVDQDGNKLTTLEGSYGDKKLSLHWTLDSENFIEFGSAPGSIVVDDSLISEIEQQIPDSTYVGDIEYNGKKYNRRRNQQWSRIIGTKHVAAGEYCIFNYEPIVWFKVATFDAYKSIYFSVYSLKYFNITNSQTPYDQHIIRAYLNGEFINQYFTEAEKQQLVDYQADNTSQIISSDKQGPGTVDKVFIPSYKEHSEWLPRLETFKVYGAYYSLKHGLITDAECIYDSTNTLGDNHGRISYGGYYIRTVGSGNYLYMFNPSWHSSTTGNYHESSTSFVRPCIVLENR